MPRKEYDQFLRNVRRLTKTLGLWSRNQKGYRFFKLTPYVFSFILFSFVAKNSYKAYLNIDDMTMVANCLSVGAANFAIAIKVFSIDYGLL